MNSGKDWLVEKAKLDAEWKAGEHDRNMKWDKEHRDSQESRLIRSKEDGWGCATTVGILFFLILYKLFT